MGDQLLVKARLVQLIISGGWPSPLIKVSLYHPVSRPGLLILTNKRLFFYGPDVSKNLIFEEYSFAKISNLKEQKRLFSNQIVFMYDTEWKRIKHIQTNDVSGIVQQIKEQLSK